MRVDSASQVDVRPALPNVRFADNTTQVGVTVDQGLWNSCTFFVAAGTLADADATFTVLVEDSADNVTFSAVDDLYLIGTEAGASFVFSDDNTVHKIGYIGPNRYARISIVPANNSGNADVSAVAVLGNSRHR
jgi:hypothetical protein